MAPRSSSPSYLDDDDDYAAAAATSSPVRRSGGGSSIAGGTGRRTRAEYEGDTDTVDPNELAFVQNYAARKKLKRDDVDDVKNFMGYSPAVQNAILFVNDIVHDKQLAEMKASLPASKFEVPDAYKINGQARAFAILFKPTTTVFKGSAITNPLMDALIELGCDLPPNVRDSTANLKKLKKATGDYLSDARAAFKKDLHKSFNVGPNESAPNARATEHQPLFELTQFMARHIAHTKITYEHCAHVALMRKVYLKCVTSDPPKDDFWGELEKAAGSISDAAFKAAEEKDNPKPTPAQVAARLSKIYKSIVEKDRAMHGNLDNEKDGIDDLASGRAGVTGSAFGARAGGRSEREGPGEDEGDEQ
ncbi:hypothetical protein C8F01DRAFT_1231625 [Mycena amicta]|nr:hypothetical protein C8F01DRAFT_1231625 [Mycena amicta]